MLVKETTGKLWAWQKNGSAYNRYLYFLLL